MNISQRNIFQRCIFFKINYAGSRTAISRNLENFKQILYSKKVEIDSSKFKPSKTPVAKISISPLAKK